MEETLGKRIASHRKRLGLTQDQLAEKLGITAQAVSKWENDLSCPDITMLPKLADIFHTTTDALLGRKSDVPVCETQIVDDAVKDENGFTFNNGKIDLHWDGAKLEGIGLACWVLLTGVLYLVTQLLHIDASIWNIMWPSSLLTFGIFGLFPKFSAFRLGCALFGGYFLIDKLHLLPVQLNGNILVAVAVLLLGLALLVDALQKRNKPEFSGSFTDKNGKTHYGKARHDYTVKEDSFTYEASFGTSTQLVVIDTLRGGSISTNFGEYTVDLTGVAAVESGCRLVAECNFGELTIQVPRHYTVIADSSTAFASFEIKGQPSVEPAATIYLDASVNFGEITLSYI